MGFAPVSDSDILRVNALRDNAMLTPSGKRNEATWYIPGRFFIPLMLSLVMVLGGCATTQPSTPESEEESFSAHPEDPWEGFNRRVFAFNDVLDRYTLKPISQAYVKVIPSPVRTGVGNVFSNLGEIRTAINSLLQGKPSNAGLATSRFLINSTVGIGGLLDYATLMEISADKEDFGQTLGVWGWEDSRYLVLPLWGPSTLRDTTGLLPDRELYPITYLDGDVEIPLQILRIVHARAGILDQESMIQGERYRFVRDAYLQRRNFVINDGELGDDPFASDDFEFDDADFDDDAFAD